MDFFDLAEGMDFLRHFNATLARAREQACARARARARARVRGGFESDSDISADEDDNSEFTHSHKPQILALSGRYRLLSVGHEIKSRMVAATDVYQRFKEEVSSTLIIIFVSAQMTMTAERKYQ